MDKNSKLKAVKEAMDILMAVGYTWEDSFVDSLSNESRKLYLSGAKVVDKSDQS